MILIGVRGSLERDISSLRALGPGGGHISRVVHVSTRADFGVFAEKYGFVQEGHTFMGETKENTQFQNVKISKIQNFEIQKNTNIKFRISKTNDICCFFVKNK